jgi:hypothetical protein
MSRRGRATDGPQITQKGTPQMRRWQDIGVLKRALSPA